MWGCSRTRYLLLNQFPKQFAVATVDSDRKRQMAGKRFARWGIPYHRVRRGQADDGQELMTVVAGYPGTIHYRPREKR